MDIEQIKELMAYLEQSSLSKVVFKKGDFELQLEKQISFAAAPRHIETYEEIAAPKSKKEMSGTQSEESVGSFVTSPMVGTFYASPSPDQSHFVKVGDKVHEGTIICIIEAMKVMNEVKAGIKGTVAEILIHNGQPVEFGSRLFRIV